MPSPFALSVLVVLAQGASAPRFFPDDPVRVDPDDGPISRPAAVELSTAWDVLEHTFAHRPRGPVPPARNVNTLGEVPDSSWFTNRIGARALSLEELVRGPVTTEGTDSTRPMRVVRAKSGGISPGFTIVDARGDTYFVKPDPPDHPALATASDVIGSKFFWAMGYHVPENHIAWLRRDHLVVAPEARVTLRGGARRAMTEVDVDVVLSGAHRRADGAVRVVASRRIEGEPLGPHKFHGTRRDDPNDRVPHEHRRDLRGYRVFCAWLNHDDSRSLNTFDAFVATEGGRGHVRHYLVDFSSILGAGSDARRRIAPQNRRAGNEYVLEAAPGLKTAASLGLWERPWRRVRYREFPEVGRIEAEFFRPEAWRPEYPNPAFERMRPADALWAARIVSRFSDEAVRAIVHTGQFEDPAAERHLAEVLLQRRRKIVEHYFGQMNPLAEFRLVGGPAVMVLEFENLGAAHGLGPVEGYDVEWREYDNLRGTSRPLAPSAFSAAPRMPVPGSEAEYVLARVRTRGGPPAWRKAVDVYIRRGNPDVIVGLEREE